MRILYIGSVKFVHKVREIKDIKKTQGLEKFLEVNSNSFIVKTMDNAIEILDEDFEFLLNKGEYL